MSEQMTFPNTFDEFAEQYKIVDTKEIYTNGTEMIPIFRAKQWLEHIGRKGNGLLLTTDRATGYFPKEFLIGLIEKQIPKKPIIGKANFIDFQDFCCPSCNKKIITKIDGEWIAGRLQKYCDDCGQALDWSDTE